jgi:serine/threonine protein kinase
LLESNIKNDNQEDLFTSKPELNMENLEIEARGSFVGTEDYIAPEIINSEPSTFASDLWSLGVIAF